eukprot:297653_1
MANDMIVYHGLNCFMLFSSFSFFAAGPTSTSIDRTIAYNFTNSNGIILELKCRVNTGRWKAMYFDCEIFSDYSHERERLFLQSQLIMNNIIDTKNMKQYDIHFKIFQWLQMVVDGWSIVKTGIYNTDKNISKKLQKILAKMIKNELNSNRPRTGDEYIFALFHNW